MKSDDLEKRMRIFETAHDHAVLPGMNMVARLDGRGFTRLTKERHAFEAPFDERFRDYMVSTTTHLMDCGFRFLFGYTQSDEISLLFDPSEDAFGRKLRKLHSVLAGEASSAFTVQLGAAATFDCRISQLPRRQDVVDYFRWRQSDAGRNALSAHCYWALRAQGRGSTEATAQLEGLGVDAKNELLFRRGTNFNDLPNWQKRGIGLYYEEVERRGANPVSGEAVTFTRRVLKTDFELPMGQAFGEYVGTLLEGSSI